MALKPGTKLGPYEIQSLLGAGGMGEVYRARDTRLQRTVAIKVLPAHLSSDADLHARFEQEAKSISGLQHPNICVVHDIGSQDGVDYMVMSRVKQPVLMLNGHYDFFFPVESTQDPFFNLLGSKKDEKKHMVYESSHAIPRNELIKEMLNC